MSRVNLDELRAQLEILRFIKDKRAELKQLEETARETIELALGDNDEGTLDGHVVVTWKTHKRKALNQKLLRDTYPDIYENCKDVTEVRRFEVVDDVGDDT